MAKLILKTVKAGICLLICCSPLDSMGQCGNTTLNLISAGESCDSSQESFSITGAPNHDQVRWKWGDGNSRTTLNLSENYNYQSPGSYNPSVEFLDANGSVICEVNLATTITIYEKPQADFNVVSNQFQCFKGNEFSFQDATSIGDAPITERSWKFSDGGPHSDTGTSVTHSYAQAGTYAVILQITDSNGCKDLEEKMGAAQVAKAIGDGFTLRYLTTTGRPTCPQTEVEFTNQTPDQNRIQDYTFDPGDGSGLVSLNIPWSTYKHVYKEDGPFEPSLVVTDSNGCKDTFTRTADNYKFSFDENVLPGDSVKCLRADTFNFAHTIRDRADRVTWNFGHAPPPGPTVLNEWSGTHNFGDNMGVFDITLEIRESPSCIKDTVYQNAVGLEGPKAHIQHPGIGQGSPPNTYLAPEDQVITKEDFEAINKSDCGPQSIQYLLSPNSTGNTQTWQRGDPIPQDTVYGPASGIFNYQNVHDSDIYDPDCKAPNLVRFTNNSVKFRLERNANGDLQSPLNSIQYNDDETRPLTTKQDVPSPGGNWASDSLEFFWNFNDPSAEACTTQTVAESQSPQGRKCNFSTAKTPYHLFDTSQCFSVQLEVYDSVTQCKDQTSIQIVSSEPNAGWEKAFYEKKRNLTYQNYSGQDSIAFDSLLNWTSPVNNVPVKQLLASRVLKNKDITVFDNNGSPVNSSDYEVENYDLAWLKFTGSKPPNGDVQIIYNAKQPEIFLGTDTVSIDTMTHATQLRLDAKYGADGGPRRGIFLKGANCEGATQNIQQLKGTYPTAECGGYGRDFGFVPDREAFADTVTCVDSIDTNNDGAFDATKTKQRTQYQWISGNQVVANPFAWNWEFTYDEPGCKTPGLWMQTGDCYDTFWYEDYKYIAEADPSHTLLDYDDQTPYSEQEMEAGFCLGENGSGIIGKDSFTLLVKPADPDQDNITEYRLTLSSVDPLISGGDYTAQIGGNSVVKKVYQFCTDSIVAKPDGQGGTTKVCNGEIINYPEQTCGPSITDGLSLQEMLNAEEFNIYDSSTVINMNDTAALSLKQPGIYKRSSRIENAQRCMNETNNEELLTVGHYSNYDSYVPGRENNDSTVCVGDTVFFKNPDAGRGNYFYYINHHLPTYFDRHEVEVGSLTEIRNLREDRIFQDPKGRDGGIAGGYQYEQVEYDLNGDGIYETKYDIDTLLFTQDQDLDGSYETTLQPRDVTNDGQADTVPYYVYESSGTYDIALKSTDSTGCEQIRQKAAKVVVTDVRANIRVKEAPGPCVPETVNFHDSSVLTNAYRYFYDESGNVKDSVRVDNITQWEWTIENGKTDTLSAANPTYTFRQNGQFNPQLKVTTGNGCSGVTTQMTIAETQGSIDSFITLNGPQPGFFVENTQDCIVELKDTTTGGEQWTFFKGNGEKVTFVGRPQDSLFTLKYDEEGTYCLYERVTSKLVDANGDSVTCPAYFPKNGDVEDSACIDVTLDGPAEVTADFTGEVSDLTIDLNNLSTNADSYLWYFGDGTTDTTENPEHTFAEKDSFTVCLKAMNACASDSVCKSYNLTPFSRDNERDANVDAYPNPVTADLHVESYSPGADLTYQIFDATGIKVGAGQIAQGTQEHVIAMDGFTPGVYWIRFESPTYQKVKMIVVAD